MLVFTDRKGSVITEFTITYAVLNSIQILKLQEHVTMTGNLSKLPAQILNISAIKGTHFSNNFERARLLDLLITLLIYFFKLL
jgi:hypothetical protein